MSRGALKSYELALEDHAYGVACTLSANVRKSQKPDATCPEMSANVRKSRAEAGVHKNKNVAIRSGNFFMPSDSGMHFYMFSNSVRTKYPKFLFSDTGVVRKCPQMSENPEIHIFGHLRTLCPGMASWFQCSVRNFYRIVDSIAVASRNVQEHPKRFTRSGEPSGKVGVSANVRKSHLD